jgi:hypothetical protein
MEILGRNITLIIASGKADTMDPIQKADWKKAVRPLSISPSNDNSCTKNWLKKRFLSSISAVIVKQLVKMPITTRKL